MKYSCLHTHTTFCDGHDEIETCCCRAFEKGLVSIGFSAHGPIQKTGICTDWHLQEERLEEYLDTVRKARVRWEGRLSVFLGLEVDYIKGRIGPGDHYFQKLGLDYIIGSVHYIVPPKGEKLFTVDDSSQEFEQCIQEGFSGNADALAAAYWDAVEAMIHEGGFDILGHADLIKKNNLQNQWFSLDGTAYRRRITDIAKIIGDSSLVVELNTGGMIRYKMPEAYPSSALLQLLHEKEVPIIIAADAHKAEHLGGCYDQAREILLRAGYTHTVLFQGRKENKPMWSQEPL